MIAIPIEENNIPLLHGTNGKFVANVEVVHPNDPIPNSNTAITAAAFTADGKAAIGNDVSLGVSAATTVTLAALFEGDQPVLQMAAPGRKPKKVLTPSELAEQFRELQRLREKVRALEQSPSRPRRTVQSDAK